MALRFFGRASSKKNVVSEEEALDKLVILRDLPKARYANRPALTVHPASGVGKPLVFSHLDVYKMVESVAHTLRESGVRPKTMVATALPAGVEGVVTFFALQWVNAIAISLDPTLSQESMRASLITVGATILISPFVEDDEKAEHEVHQKTEALASEFSALSWHVKYSRNSGVELITHDKPYGPPAWRGGASDYTADPTEVSVYTFSPGAETPLVLGLTHQNVAAAAKSFAKSYDLFDREDVIISKSQTVLTVGLSDVQGVLLLVSSLYAGGKIVIPPNGSFKPSEFWKLVEMDDLTWLSVNGAQFQELYESTSKDGSIGTKKKLQFIRVCGDDFLDVTRDVSFEEMLGCPILESYGPPEASGLVTTETFQDSGEGTMGPTVHGCSVSIFSTGAERSKLAPNQEGDIAVLGDNVTSGFLNDDDENAESAIRFEGENGVEEWFCTGDRGELDETGRLRMTGSARAQRALARKQREEERLREANALAAEELNRRLAEEEARREIEEEEERKRAAAAAVGAAAVGAAVAADGGENTGEGRQVRRLTAQEIENVGKDWCIVTPFLGIPNDDDDVEEKVVLMRRVTSAEEDAVPVVEIADLPDTELQKVLTDEGGADPTVAAAAIAAASAVPKDTVAAEELPEDVVSSSQGKPIKKKVVKFAGVTYEYFYTDEDDQEMLMELLGERSEEIEKKRSVKLPPKYKGGFYTEEIDENERIQVRVMTSKEAIEFRRSLEKDFASKLEAEKKRMRDEYEALLAAALREQEEQFTRNYNDQRGLVATEYEKQFKTSSETQKEEVQQRLLAESRARQNIYNELLAEKNEKGVNEAVALLQEKRLKDREEIKSSIVASKQELSEGLQKKLKEEEEQQSLVPPKEAGVRFAVGNSMKDVEVEEVEATDSVNAPSPQIAGLEYESVMTEPTLSTSARDVSASGDESLSRALTGSSETSRMGIPKTPNILMYLDQPEEMEADIPDVDKQFLERMRTIKDEERKLWRKSVVAAVDNSAIQVIRGVEDKHTVDEMSYESMLSTIQALRISQEKLEEALLYKNREDLYRARELAEALAEERSKMDILNQHLMAQALDVASEPVLNQANLEMLEASVLDAAASAEEGRAATEMAVEAVKKALDITENCKLSTEAAAAAATAAATASERAADVSHQAASRSPAVKDVIYREVTPDEVVSETVKKRSVVVDLKTIDEAMRKHPSVVDARAFTTPSRKTTFELNVAVQLRRGARASESWLKQHAHKTLPMTAAPTRFFYTYGAIPPGRKSLAWSDALKPFPRSDDKMPYIPPRNVKPQMQQGATEQTAA